MTGLRLDGAMSCGKDCLPFRTRGYWEWGSGKSTYFSFMNADGKSYSREEIRRAGQEYPTRGPFCPKCKKHIPQFEDLSSETESRIKHLIVEGRLNMAMIELRASTGCPLSWAKLWVNHSGRPDVYGTTAPCPYCGKPLKTARARQCQHCLMDWHDQSNPKSLRDIPFPK